MCIEKETEYGCGILVVAKELRNTGIAVSIPKLRKYNQITCIFTKHKTATFHTSHSPARNSREALTILLDEPNTMRNNEIRYVSKTKKKVRE
jgi:hypothetical protein